jgi:hypothetical protein
MSISLSHLPTTGSGLRVLIIYKPTRIPRLALVLDGPSTVVRCRLGVLRSVGQWPGAPLLVQGSSRVPAQKMSTKTTTSKSVSKSVLGIDGAAFRRNSHKPVNTK